jgi:hypothetical protein
LVDFKIVNILFFERVASQSVQTTSILPKMSNFPSIEEFDSGHVTATKFEDASDDGDNFQSAEDDFLAREQAILGDDAAFFQSAGNTTSPPAAQGGAALFDNGNECQKKLISDEDVQEFQTSFPAIDTTVTDWDARVNCRMG